MSHVRPCTQVLRDSKPPLPPPQLTASHGNTGIRLLAAAPCGFSGNTRERWLSNQSELKNATARAERAERLVELQKKSPSCWATPRPRRRPGDDGARVFAPLLRLSTSDVADVLQVVRARVLRHLMRQGVVELGPDVTWDEAGLAGRDPALAQLAAAAVSGLPPAGPELRRRPQVPLRGRSGVLIAAPLSVSEMGFSLDAATHTGAHDDRSREALVTYILRPPLADELTRLCATAPPPRQHTVRYAGVLAAAAKWRAH